ncbi:MAG: major facilitator superfamily 1 [Bacilli bacterium]|jgi:MFS family permease|nr:major facilitator superfamily 1 [Bacilli bacterium]
MNSEIRLVKMGLNMEQGTWNNFRWDFLATVFVSFFSVTFNQFFTPLAIQHGASNFQVGLLSAAPAIGLVFAPFWASIVEKGNPKLHMFYPNFIARILIVLPLIHAKPWVYVMTALMINLLLGIQAPAYASIITRIYPADLRGRLMGNVRVAMGALMIPLAYLIGRWIDSSGGRIPTLIAVVTGVISICLFTRVKEIVPLVNQTKLKKRASLRDQLKLITENKKLALFFAATTAAGFGNLLASPLYQIIQVQKLELSNLQIGYARMMYFFCLLLAYLIMGRVIDRYSPKRAMFFGIAAYGIAPVLYALFANYPAVIIAGGFQGIGDAIWDIGCLSYVIKMAPGREAVAFGLHLMLFGIRGTIAPLLSTSLIHTVSMPVILCAAAFCCLVGFLLFFTGNKSGNE